jgi:hypothetical protein
LSDEALSQEEIEQGLQLAEEYGIE